MSFNQVRLNFPAAESGGAEALVALRIEAMRESLERIGRFDPDRARQLFLDGFEPAQTQHIEADGERIVRRVKAVASARRCWRTSLRWPMPVGWPFAWARCVAATRTGFTSGMGLSWWKRASSTFTTCAALLCNMH